MSARFRRPFGFGKVTLVCLAFSSWIAVGTIPAGAEEARGTVADLPVLNTEVAFPNLKFDRPVVMAYPDDGSNLMFVVEQHQAKIWSFPADRATSDKQLFLELPDEINRDNEEGFLGLAFHPRYKENGEFFVYYSAKDPAPHPRRSVVSRFKVSANDPRKADPRSEKRIWVSADDPFSNHNGGCILFGPDGYLYISLGDSGAGGDPLKTGQDPRDWFGSILRIDVDHPSGGKAYGIPKDNPRLRDRAYAAWAPEVYCIGLRNVWRFSFDRATGTLWAGDVGQNEWEMVYILENGGNYGWSLFEGTHPFERQRPKRRPFPKITAPIHEYSHREGVSITGGYVYRGKALPGLYGTYLFADFGSRRLWGLREKDGKATEVKELVRDNHGIRLDVSSFAEDRAGEVYMLAFDGRIHRLVPKH